MAKHKLKIYKKMIELFNEDNKDLMARLPNESIDVICVDPPYLYLKNQKLERPFDEKLFFSECKRLLTTNGFIVMFGRGESFYRWNTLLSDLGFTFKEEIVWNKRMNSLPGLALQRFHETISIFSRGNGKIRKVRIPYLEKKKFDLPALQNDIKRIKSALNSPEFDDLKKFIESGNINYTPKKYNNFFKNGYGERSRATATMKSIKNGMVEGSIIEVLRGHYDTVHPTQKPVRLLERLLALVIPDKPKNEIMVADFFGGSFSTMEAVFNMGMNGISCEIDKEYFEAGKQRIESLQPNLFSSEL